MLPERVSNHLCSLNPKTDRLAMSVMMHISADGEVRDYSFHNSVIHSKERMTYDDVQKIIDGDEAVAARYARSCRRFARSIGSRVSSSDGGRKVGH
jgi:ribonuclease R